MFLEILTIQSLHYRNAEQLVGLQPPQEVNLLDPHSPLLQQSRRRRNPHPHHRWQEGQNPLLRRPRRSRQTPSVGNVDVLNLERMCLNEEVAIIVFMSMCRFEFGSLRVGWRE